MAGGDVWERIFPEGEPPEIDIRVAHLVRI